MSLPLKFYRHAPIQPRRITMALDIAGLHGPDVDRMLGGEEPMVDEWEAGITEPTTHQLQRLAFLTGWHPTWFRIPIEHPIDEDRIFLCTGQQVDP